MALRYKVIITPDAQQCIQDITGYLAENVSLETATKVNQAIIDSPQMNCVDPIGFRSQKTAAVRCALLGRFYLPIASSGAWSVVK